MKINLISTHKLFVFLGIFLMAWAARAQQPSTFGALAVDSPQGARWGYSYNHPNARLAGMRALKECGANCKIVVRFENGCAAYAASQEEGSTVYGWGKSASAEDAKNRALLECNARGNQCIIRTWACSSR